MLKHRYLKGIANLLFESNQLKNDKELVLTYIFLQFIKL